MKPKHAEEIEEAKRLEAQLRRDNTHAAVWPDGRVTEHFCPPPPNGVVGMQQGDCPLLWVNGSVQVVERWRKKGVRLFDDVCRDDGRPELIERRRSAALHRGKVEIRDYISLYPPTVLRLRRESESGVSSDMIFDSSSGELVKATPEIRANRVADLVESAGLGRPVKEGKSA